jgi:hypothetical protein
VQPSKTKSCTQVNVWTLVYLAGISTVLEELVRQLPIAVPPTAAECQAAISAAQPTVHTLQVRGAGWQSQWVRSGIPSAQRHPLGFGER